MNLIEAFVTENDRYKAKEPLKPVGLIIHSIGCPQPSAKVLHDNWARNSSPYVTHYNCDDSVVYHNVPDNFKCWHVSAPGNSKYIGCEMGEPKEIKYTSGDKFTCSDKASAMSYCTKTYYNAVELFAYLCKKHGFDPMTQIFTHHYLSVNKLSNTTHTDPVHLWTGLGLPFTLDTFRQDVKTTMERGIENVVKQSKYETTPVPVKTEGHTTLVRGDKGVEVREMQTKLITAGYSCGDSGVDGHFGADTSASLKAFQKDRGLSVDGICGKMTWAELDKVYEQKDVKFPYIVKITASMLNIRKGAGINYPIVGEIPKGGAYTIIEEKDGWGLLKSYQRDKDGWICLSYTEKK